MIEYWPEQLMRADAELQAYARRIAELTDQSDKILASADSLLLARAADISSRIEQECTAHEAVGRLKDQLIDEMTQSVMRYCMVKHIFRKLVHHRTQPDIEFSDDVETLLKRREAPVCNLAVWRGLRECGLHERFVPSAGEVVGYIDNEQARLERMLDDINRLEISGRRLHQLLIDNPRPFQGHRRRAHH